MFLGLHTLRAGYRSHLFRAPLIVHALVVALVIALVLALVIAALVHPVRRLLLGRARVRLALHGAARRGGPGVRRSARARLSASSRVSRLLGRAPLRGPRRGAGPEVATALAAQRSATLRVPTKMRALSS